MGTLPLNDRITVGLVATGGQTDFAADFPAIAVAGVLAGVSIRRLRAGVEAFLVLGTDFTIVSPTGNGFIARLTVGASAGDVLFIYGDLPAARTRAWNPGGAVTTEGLEDDATSLEVQLQEARRDLGRSLRLPLGETLAALPPPTARASKYLATDGTGALGLFNPPVAAPSNTVCAFLATAALLRTEAAYDGKVAIVRTYAGVVGSGGMFVFDAASTATEDGGLVIKPTAIAGGSPGRWLRDLTGTPWVDLKWYGADPTGATAADALFNPWISAAMAALLPAKASHGRYKFAAAQLINLRAVRTTGLEVFGDGSEKTVFDFRGVATYPNLGVGVPADLTRDNTATLIPRDFDYFKIHGLTIWGDQAGHVFRLGLALDGNDGVGTVIQTGQAPTVAAYGYVDYCNFPEAWDFHVQNFNTSAACRAVDLNNIVGCTRWDMEANGGTGGYIGGLGTAVRINNCAFARFLGSLGSAQYAVEFDGGFIYALDFDDVDMENVKTCVKINITCQFVDDIQFDGGQWSYSSWGIEVDDTFGENLIICEPHNNPASAFGLNGTLTNGSAVVTAISSTDGMVTGRGVTGVGVPGGATILSIDSAVQITLSANATASGVKALTFAGPAASDFIKTGADYGVTWREGATINQLTVNNQKGAVSTLTIANGGHSATFALNSANGQLLIRNVTPDAFITLLVDVVGGAVQLDADVHQFSLHDGTLVLSSAAGVFSFVNPVSVGAHQVIGPRVTGWGAASSTLSRAAYASYAGQVMGAGYVQAAAQATDDGLKALSQRVAALITDLTAHGLIGA